MDRDRRLRVYGLHSWLGIGLGLFVYIVSFTGCLALFHHELKSWEDPARRLTIASPLTEINETFLAWVNAQPAEKVVFIGFDYPNVYEPYYAARLFYNDVDGQSASVKQRWRSDTLAPLPQRAEGLSDWLLGFHQDLMWPATLGGRTVGRALVGLAGVILMLSILTGLVTHRKMLQELFTLRLYRSIRVKWKDAHNILGLWGLPFYTMISFSGAFLGIVALLLPVMAALVVKGDTEKLMDAIGIGLPVPAGIHAPMLSIDKVFTIKYPDSGYSPSSVFISNWGDKSALYQINYPADTELLSFEALAINGVTGEPAKGSVFIDRTVTNRVFGAIAPLHYGTYGGIALKLLYFVLGLSLCAVSLLGIMVWLERRLHSAVGKKTTVFYQRLGRFSIGITLGNAIASVSIFFADKFYMGSEASRIICIGTTYFSVWLVIIIYSMWRENNYRTLCELMGLCGFLLLALPVVNGFMSNDFIWRAFSSAYTGSSGHIVSAWVDASFWVLAVIVALVVWRLPKARDT